jgi:hypothetical protein
MLPLETKQSGSKLLPHSDLRVRVFLEEASRSRQARQRKRGNLREGDHRGDPGLDGRIILEWIFGKWVCGLEGAG